MTQTGTTGSGISGASQTKLLTRYLIFETDADAVVFTRIGEKLANGSEDALRKFVSEPPADREGFLVAVSENNFKLRTMKATVRTSLGDADLPDLSAGAGAPEPVTLDV